MQELLKARRRMLMNTAGQHRLTNCRHDTDPTQSSRSITYSSIHVELNDRNIFMVRQVCSGNVTV